MNGSSETDLLEHQTALQMWWNYTRHTNVSLSFKYLTMTQLLPDKTQNKMAA